jgi:hypothetical protein
MPDIILLGIPKQQLRRLKAALAKHGTIRSGWALRLVYSAREDIVSITESVLDEGLQHASMCSSAHLLAFRPKTKEQQDATLAATQPYFRFRWADNSQLQLIPGQVSQFFSYLSQELAIEEEWSNSIRPQDVRSPLILPQRSFVVQPAREHIWTISATAASSDQIRGAANALSVFRDAYWRTLNGGYASWTDEVGNVFDHTGPRHGIAPFPRSWKYSFAIPTGFHFDVKALSGRAFRVSDHAGEAYDGVAGGHINVDPHGFVV